MHPHTPSDLQDPTIVDSQILDPTITITSNRVVTLTVISVINEMTQLKIVFQSVIWNVKISMSSVKVSIMILHIHAINPQLTFRRKIELGFNLPVLMKDVI